MDYMAVNQYGDTEHGLRHPRKDLLERGGRRHANKMYVGGGRARGRHCGYVIAGMWWSVYEVKPINS